jgi:hypothetical protein
MKISEGADFSSDSIGKWHEKMIMNRGKAVILHILQTFALKHLQI